MMEIFKGVTTKDMLFLDIETVRCVDDIKDWQGTQLYESFEYKTRYARETIEKFGIEDLGELWKEKSPLWSEFSKIVCITLGYITGEDKLRLKSYVSDDEAQILTDFMADVNRFHNANPNIKIVGHAVAGFDVPTIMRRCVINQVKMNTLFDCSNKKPWEVPVIDTLLTWKGSGYYSASLLNVATAMGIMSPKSDIDGSEVSDVYWKDKDLDRIKRYCERDVLCNVEVVRMMRYEQPVELEESSQIQVEGIPVIQKVYSKQSIDSTDTEELVEYMKDAGFTKQEKQTTLAIIKSAVKGGKVPKEIQTKILA